MKRILTLILAVVMIMGILPTAPIYAEDTYSYNPRTYEERLEENKQWLAIEPTDRYTLDFYTLDFDYKQRVTDETGYIDDMSLVVADIIAGITDEYEKAEAIADWLFENTVHTAYLTKEYKAERTKGLKYWQHGACGRLAATTFAFYRLAGFPAKEVGGTADGKQGWGAHAWNHVYIEGRWVYVDTSWREFDESVEHWSGDHSLGGGYDFGVKWDGTISILDTTTGREVQTLGPIPLWTPLGDIPGLSLTNLSIDAEGKYPVRPDDKFRSTHKRLFTKTHSIAFNVQLDNEYKSIVSHVVDETNGDLISRVVVPDGADFPQVKLPTKPGYTFIGWRDLNNDNGPLWNAGSGKVTEDLYLIAVFKKGAVNYTVKFNSNGGTAVKDVTTPANTTIKQPTAPTKDNYKFTGWYKDIALTKPWNFTTNQVTANTTLYAGWESTNNAKPTASKVLVNGKAVEFDAYTINNNNYFKLRDLAQAVNKTDKNFEVTWDGKNNAINLISNKPYTPAGGELVKGDGKAKAATLSTAKIFKDGKEISLTAYTINGNNYFKLRDIAKAFDIGVTWDGTTNTVGIDTSISYVE